MKEVQTEERNVE